MPQTIPYGLTNFEDYLSSQAKKTQIQTGYVDLRTCSPEVREAFVGKADLPFEEKLKRKTLIEIFSGNEYPMTTTAIITSVFAFPLLCGVCYLGSGGADFFVLHNAIFLFIICAFFYISELLAGAPGRKIYKFIFETPFWPTFERKRKSKACSFCDGWKWYCPHCKRTIAEIKDPCNMCKWYSNYCPHCERNIEPLHPPKEKKKLFREPWYYWWFLRIKILKLIPSYYNY